MIFGSEGNVIYVNKVSHSKLPNNESIDNLIVKILNNEPFRSEDGSWRVQGFSDIPSPVEETLTWGTCSPITIEITDLLENRNGFDHEGNINKEIPLSNFFKFSTSEGGFLPAQNSYLMNISALDSGVFTLLIKKVDGDGEVELEIDYQDIPIIESSRASIALDGNLEDYIMILDVEGDGENDFFIDPTQDSNKTISLLILEHIVKSFDINYGVKTAIIKEIRAAGNLIDKGQNKSAIVILTALQQQINNGNFANQLTEENAKIISNIIEKLKAGL